MSDASSSPSRGRAWCFPAKSPILSHICVRAPLLVPSNPVQRYGLQPTRLLCPWDFPGKNTGVDCHFFLHGIFPTQGSNPCFLHWWADSFQLSHLESRLLHTSVLRGLPRAVSLNPIPRLFSVQRARRFFFFFLIWLHHVACEISVP